MLTTNQTFQGTLAAISSSFLFSLMFLFGLFMLPLTGTQVASWRVLMMLLSLLILVSFTKQWQNFKNPKRMADIYITYADIGWADLAVYVGAGQWFRS